MPRTSTRLRQQERLHRLDVGFERLRRLWESSLLRTRFHQRLGVQVEAGVVRTLRAVANSGSEAGVREVAAAMSVDASTASRLVEQAVAAGYLQRSTPPADRRRSVLALTPSGADLLERANRIREEVLTELTAGWSDEDVEQLAQLLARLAARLDEMERRA